MAQDADNRCHTFETLEITTVEKTRKGSKDEYLPALLATNKNRAHMGKPKHPAVPRSTPTEGRVRRAQREAVPTQGRARVCQFTFAIAWQMQPTFFSTCQMDFVSHWTRHDIVLHGIRFSAHRQFDVVFHVFFYTLTNLLLGAVHRCKWPSAPIRVFAYMATGDLHLFKVMTGACCPSVKVFAVFVAILNPVTFFCS